MTNNPEVLLFNQLYLHYFPPWNQWFPGHPSHLLCHPSASNSIISTCCLCTDILYKAKFTIRAKIFPSSNNWPSSSPRTPTLHESKWKGTADARREGYTYFTSGCISTRTMQMLLSLQTEGGTACMWNPAYPSCWEMMESLVTALWSHCRSPGPPGKQ